MRQMSCVGHHVSDVMRQRPGWPRPRRWIVLTLILMLAALMRFPALDCVPPGWRDDELIEIDMDWRIAQGWRPLYIREAEGHEPLYHYLHAGTLWLFGRSLYSYRWLPAACGTLSTALLVSLVWRLFDFRVAALAGAFYGVGMWPVLYSRFGVRHIGVMPFVLFALYALSQVVKFPSSNLKNGHLRLNVMLGISMGLGLYIYYAAWVVPVLTLVLGGYVFVFDRTRFKQVWRGLLTALVVAGAIFFPLGWDLAHGPRVTRIEVTGAPFRKLLEGDPRPVLETTLGTLGMFTFAGDPEWLYNFSGLPVFDWVMGTLFYLGLLVCLLRLRDLRYGFVLTWLIVGLSPAFISVPPASFSHTMAAQGVIYLMPALALGEISNLKSPISNSRGVRFEVGYLILLLWSGWYTYHYYFDWWTNHAMVRFQYHADTHDLARWLNARAEGGDLAISTTSTQFALHPFPLEPFALSLDLQRRDMAPRWFDAEWALVLPRSSESYIVLLSFPHINPRLSEWLPLPFFEYHNPPTGQLAFRVYRVGEGAGPRCLTQDDLFNFDSRLALVDTALLAAPSREGGEGSLVTTWCVRDWLDSPLKIFVHLLDAEGQMIGGDDRLNVLVESLRPGDMFVHLHRLPRPAGIACTPCRMQIGLYNPQTGQRWRTSQADHIILPIEVRP